MTSEFSDRRTFLRLGGAALAAAGTAGCLGSGRSSSTRTVEMTAEFAFDPETVTVDAGGTVTWTNASDVGHTVTAFEDGIPADAYFASGGFDSQSAAANRPNEGLIPPGETYEHTFERAGRYRYYCVPHRGSGMVGSVRVERP